MSKNIISISINGMRAILRTSDEPFVSISIKNLKSSCYIDNSNDIEALGNWLLGAAHKIKEIKKDKK